MESRSLLISETLNLLLEREFGYIFFSMKPLKMYKQEEISQGMGSQGSISKEFSFIFF